MTANLDHSLDLPLNGPSERTIPARKRGRIALIDVLRGAALAAMAIYHFAWDLEFFGLADLGVTERPAWVWFAHGIAGGFLALVGFSLHLAHAGGMRLRPFLLRLGMIGAAAGAITLASWWTDPEGIIWFGILHHIAVASILGLFFLRWPALPVAALAAVCLAAPQFFTSPVFDAPGWLWLGLASSPQPSNDYVPLLPWFAMVLAGIALARVTTARGQEGAWMHWQPRGSFARSLALAGRHSLLVYLLHQPLLMAALWGLMQIGALSPA